MPDDPKDPSNPQAGFTRRGFIATIGTGDLIKLQDDGNPDTTADSAVYYVGSDGKRYAFPNAQAYFTWYRDFSLVKIVSAQEMASFQLGGNVAARVDRLETFEEPPEGLHAFEVR